MAMARRDSVTVSMAADISGVFSVMFLVSWIWVATWVGTTSLYAGTSRTSSKVRASGMGVMIICSRCTLFVLRCSLRKAWAGVLLIVGWRGCEGKCSCRLQVVSCRSRCGGGGAEGDGGCGVRFFTACSWCFVVRCPFYVVRCGLRGRFELPLG